MGRFIDDNDARRCFQVPRLSERVRARLAATWYPPSRRRIFAGRPQPVPVEVLDISVDGALVMAPTHDGLEIGQRFQFELDGVRSAVEIRNIRPSSSASKSYYGVYFYNIRPDFELIVRAIVTSGRRPGLMVG